jgi:hypothetical protein
MTVKITPLVSIMRRGGSVVFSWKPVVVVGVVPSSVKRTFCVVVWINTLSAGSDTPKFPGLMTVADEISTAEAGFKGKWPPTGVKILFTSTGNWGWAIIGLLAIVIIYSNPT